MPMTRAELIADGRTERPWGWERAVRATDYVTKSTICRPAEGDCPMWMKFLEEVTDGDTDLVDFLQRMCGYFLTGLTHEQKIFFLYGPGGNGKSTFVNTIARVMNTYHVTASMSLLTATNQERHPTELARLVGARLVTMNETDESKRLDEAKVKQLTGGERIAARRMGKDFFEFTPRFKLLISGNHKPALRNVDDALKRRFLIIPFMVKIEHVDKKLETRLEAEHPQILAWMLKGTRWWHQEGLNPPASVLAETAEYFESEDTIESWLSEGTVVDQQHWHANRDLFESWNDWCKRSGEFAGTRKQFVQRLKKRSDLKQLKRVGVLGFLGRRIRSDSELFAKLG